MEETKCPICKGDLMVSNSAYTSDLGSTDIYITHTMVCTNSKCSNYSGRDLNNPTNVVNVIKNKVN